MVWKKQREMSPRPLQAPPVHMTLVSLPSRCQTLSSSPSFLSVPISPSSLTLRSAPLAPLLLATLNLIMPCLTPLSEPDLALCTSSLGAGVPLPCPPVSPAPVLSPGFPFPSPVPSLSPARSP